MANPNGIGGFKPGQSGNPGGRTRAGTVEAGQALARQRFAVAVARLVTIARRGSTTDAIAAIRLLAQISGVPLTPTATTQPATQPPEPPPGFPVTPEMLREELRKSLGA